MINLFVCGRICLLGEHSDWATNYKTQNKKIVTGSALILGTEQGIHATIKKSNYVILKYKEKFKIDKDKLYDTACSDSFYSYFCASCYYMIKKYNVSGIEIDITNCDLPIKKGLSSSAAICVLTVRAYNKLYNLNMNIEDEMNAAYESERLTGSQCGKMDQVCAYGTKLTYMDFSNEKIEEIKLKRDLYVVYADLNGKKDTIKILEDLNNGYPYAKNYKEHMEHFFIERLNKYFVLKAKKSLENGNYKRLGRIYNLYQKCFDWFLSPLSKELKAPLLHKCLRNKTIKKYIYGAKGIGAGGDGSIQFIAKNKESQEQLLKYLNNSGLKAYKVVVKSNINKAIIAVAGKGTRLYPYTKFIKKEFSPVISNGMLKPMISVLLEMLYDNGITDICLGVSSRRHKKLYKDYFKKKTTYHIDNEEYDIKLNRIWKCLKFKITRNSKGFGHTVSIFKKFSNKEPVLLLLGDTLYSSNENCIKKIENVYKEYGNPIITVCSKNEDEIENCGIVKGDFINESVLKLTDMVEKPKKEYAYKKLKLNNEIYGVFGMYLLNYEILDRLSEISKIKTDREISLTDTLKEFILNKEVNGLIMSSSSYDFGNVYEYSKNFTEVK